MAIKLYFLRHGMADWPDWEGADEDRPLTKKGKKEVKRVAESLEELGVEPDVILTSPLPRSSETAKIVAKILDMDCREEPELAKGFTLEQLGPLLQKYPDQDVMLVGHEPDFSTVIAGLAGARIKLPKAGLARVDLTEPTGPALQGELAWLVPPKVLTND